MEKYAAVILAAGKGTRMGNADIPKVMFKMAGKPIIDHSVKLIKDAGVNKVVLVVGYKQEMIREYFNDKVIYAVQEQQLGTGHAAMMAQEALKGEAKEVIVFYGDSPMYRPDTVKRLMEEHEKNNATISMLTVVSPEDRDLTGYGRIIRDEDGEALGIKEHKDCNDEERKIREWNPGFYIFDGEWLWDNFAKLKTDNVQNEYYLTDMIEIAKQQGNKVIAIPVLHESEALGINTQDQLKIAEEALLGRR